MSKYIAKPIRPGCIKAISVKQPWPWLIIRPDVIAPAKRLELAEAGMFKNIENRCWPTKYRGPLFIHASSYMTRNEYIWGAEFAEHMFGILAPPMDQLQMGGIIGRVDLTDCVEVTDPPNPWFFGPYGLVMANPKPVPFRKVRGKLYLFDVPEHDTTEYTHTRTRFLTPDEAKQRHHPIHA